MLIAAIDIGTNSIHMVIAQATALGSFDVVDREREVVQIGRDSFSAGRLKADAIRRTSDALARFVQLARRHQVDRIICTATAAVREAKNGGEFLAAAREAAGVSPRVIPAEEEGRLIYLAVKSALQLDDSPSLIVDIGGGSMQLVVGNREKLMLACSAPLGALRLTEELHPSDPPNRRDLQRMRRAVRKLSRDALERIQALEPRQVYGSSGSIHALAQVAHWSETGQPIEHINGHVLTVKSLDKLTRRLAHMTLAEREQLPGLDAKRAEIILPGAIVLGHVLDEVGADRITVSDYGVREGLVTDYIAYHADEITSYGKIEDLRLRSVMTLLAKFQAGGSHTEHVARLSLKLFDELRNAHGLGEHDREMLHYAALLHDIGSAIGYDGHSEHSDYIIRNGNLRGLAADEVEIIANVARYHGKRRPRKRDKEFRVLDRATRRRVRWLAAILRIAEGLDRSHYQLIKDLRVVRRPNLVSILLTARREARLEIWATRRRTELLSRVMGGKHSKVRVRVALDRAVLQARADAQSERAARAPAVPAERSRPSHAPARTHTDTNGRRLEAKLTGPRLKVLSGRRSGLA